MRDHGKTTVLDRAVGNYWAVRNNRRLWVTPLTVAFTILVTSVGFGYYSIYKIRKQNESTDIYKESIKLLENYEPVYKYVGKPYKVRWLQEAHYTDDTLTMVVPIKGPKGKASLIINGKRGRSDEILLDHLDIELGRQNKRWTFYRQVVQPAAQQSATTSAVE